MLRVAIGEIKQESNSFSPLLTTLDSFRDGYLLFGEEIGARLRNTNAEVREPTTEGRGLVLS